MMKKSVFILFIFLFISSFSKAQFTRYIVKFRDKGNNSFSLSTPAGFLSQRSIERRTKYNIPVDSTDLPVSSSYVSRVASIPNVTILNISKWLNQVSIKTTDANAITAINTLPFVQKTVGIASRTMNANTRKVDEEEVIEHINPSSSKINTTNSNYYDYGVGSSAEIRLHHGEFLHNIGLHGEEMQIALIDAGFYKYNTFKAFDSINTNGQILDTWDFVAGNASVAEDYVHGMSCLSTIAANLPGQFIGMAPKSKFYLYRSEDVSSEYPIEEHNWVCAAERADSSGADIISSSLGYTSFDNSSLNHSYADLNGNTTMAAIGADLAAKKGILVFIAAGNSGNDSWHYIMTPADADSVLAVGAVDVNGNKGVFSSYGPSSDGRVKPDVMSVGVKAVIETSYNAPGTSNGTSYACPKMAGLGTCLWQGFPEFNNMKIIHVIRQSGSIAAHPTDSTGYGIPDMKLAFTKLLTEYATSQTVLNNCIATISWTSKDVAGMSYEIERKTPANIDYQKITEVNAQNGNILSSHSYQFNDSLKNISGTVFYRIRQIVDTTSENFTAVYIDTNSVTISGNCNITTPPVTNPPDNLSDKVVATPNPVINNELHLTVESRNAIPSLTINIYDINGGLVLQRKESKEAGKTIYLLPLSHLSAGRYTIVIYNGLSKFGAVKILKL